MYKIAKIAKFKYCISKIISIFTCYVLFQMEMGNKEKLMIQTSNMQDFIFMLYPVSLANWVLFIAITCILIKHQVIDSKQKRIAACFFSVLMVAGTCYSNFGAFISYIFGSSYFFKILCLALFIGYYTVLRYFFDMLESGKRWCQKQVLDIRIKKLLERHLFIKAILFIGILWAPYIIIRFPAGIEWDAYHQILQYIGKEPLSAHWPLVSTNLIGVIVSIGKHIFGTYERGVFCYVIVQSIVCICILSYSLEVMKKIRCDDKWILFALIIYGIVPFFPGFFTSVVKDSLYSIAVLMETILIGEVVYLGKRRFLALTISAVFVCLLRNNGIYIQLALLVVGICMSAKNKNIFGIVTSVAISIMASIYYTDIYVPALNLGPSGSGLTYEQDQTKEMMSIPFQQTARFLVYYPEDVSDEEKNIIGKVLDIHIIAENYNPLLSDMVKGTYHGNKVLLKDYFKVWLKMFFRHPDVYFDAAGELCYGFLYPNVIQRGHNLPGLYTGTNATEDLMLVTPNWLRPAIKFLELYGHLWERVPVFSFFYNTAIQNWLVIWMVIISVPPENRHQLIILIPSVIGVFVCIAAPTWWHNGFRYALPIICTNPFVYGVLSKKMKTD